MRAIAVKRSKQKEIKELEKHLVRLREKAMHLVHVAEIREYLNRVAEIRMRIAILRGEIEF
jgi:uncharacterized sporulation protein YeaH/YhbH (DUF444 family)